jgi:hypothetical protein
LAVAVDIPVAAETLTEDALVDADSALVSAMEAAEEATSAILRAVESVDVGLYIGITQIPVS